MTAKTTILIGVIAALILSAPAVAAGVGVNGNSTNGNGQLKVIVTNPDDCPEGTVPVLYEPVNGTTNGAAGSLVTVLDDLNELVLYECVPETPLVPETPTAVAEDAYPAATAPERTYLPSTGLALLPAAGLLIGGAVLMARRRD